MKRTNVHLLGQIAVKEGYVTPDQLEECIKLQGAAKDTTLGSILVAKGYLTQAKLKELTDLQRARFEAISSDTSQGGLFGQIALRHGWVNPARLAEALREQETESGGGSSLKLGQILMKKGYLTSERFLDILRLQKKEVVKCPSCDSFFDISSAQGEAKFACSNCGSVVHSSPKS